MYKIDFVVLDKGYCAVVDTRQSAFNIYYMLVGIAAERFGDWLLQLSDLDTGKIIVECYSEWMEGHLD